MMRKHAVLLVVDRSTGVVRSAPFHIPATVCALILATAFPILIGLGAKLSARAELEHLRTMHAMLEEENASYRSATNAFRDQVQSLAGVISELQINGETTHGPAAAHRVAVLERARAAGGTAPGGSALAASVAPSLSSPEQILEVLGEALQVLTNRLPSIKRSVERREALAAAAPSIWPAQGWLTGRFGVRSDPLSGEQGFHQGIDISTDEGQPVHATGDGVVEAASFAGDYGNLVVIEHSFGLTTRYGHLSRFAVAPGVAVKRGEVIGYVGATGRATGPHVHYEILINGTSIDPLQLLTTAIRP
jgi:murein DD-endopeptidase MepM/ murein hydrolase activator NlpD